MALIEKTGYNQFQKWQNNTVHAIILSKLAEKAIDSERNMRYNL